MTVSGSVSFPTDPLQHTREDSGNKQSPALLLIISQIT